MMVTSTATAGATLSGRIVPAGALTFDERNTMLALLSTFFRGVDRHTFENDLAEKSHVILLEDPAHRLRGFSTLLVYETTVVGVEATIVYSGDTIVEPGFWGSPALPVSWLAAARSLPAARRGPVYWLLLTSGFRTYRFLPVFFREFSPRASSSDSNGLLRLLALERFGDRFDPLTGIVRFKRPQMLVPALQEVPPGRLMDEHVAFFLERNPGHVRGDELVCLTRIADDNLTPAGQRIARRLERAR